MTAHMFMGFFIVLKLYKLTVFLLRIISNIKKKKDYYLGQLRDVRRERRHNNKKIGGEK